MTRRTNGFTIIEVLVTISLIAVLLVILLPNLTTGRRETGFAQCISNMRAFAIAQNLYATDNDYNFVPTNWGPATGGWLYYKERTPGARNFVAPGSVPYLQRIEMRETGLLFDYLDTDGQLYHCPVDEGPFDDAEIRREEGTSVSFPVRAMTSYTFNGAFRGYGGPTPPGGTFAIDLFKPNDIFLWEADALSTRAQNGYWNDGANRPDEGLAERHLDGAPVSRVDGSADKMVFEDFYEIVRDRTRNELWCSPDSANGR